MPVEYSESPTHEKYELPCLSVSVTSPMVGGLCPKLRFFSGSGACSLPKTKRQKGWDHQIPAGFGEMLAENTIFYSFPTQETGLGTPNPIFGSSRFHAGYLAAPLMYCRGVHVKRTLYLTQNPRRFPPCVQYMYPRHVFLFVSHPRWRGACERH